MILGSISCSNVGVEPRPSSTNSHLIPQQRAIHVPIELLSPRYSTFQSHRTFQALIRPLLVVVRYESFCFGEVLFDVRMQSCGKRLLNVRPIQISVASTRFYPRKNCRASALAVHSNVSTATSLADSQHPYLWWRRGGGGTSYSTASVIRKSQPFQTYFGAG